MTSTSARATWWSWGGRDGDWIKLGVGDHTIAGDIAELDFTAGVQTDFNGLNDVPDAGGDDTIDAGDGLNWVIGGQGGDDIDLGHGGGVVLGDNGRIQQTSGLAFTRIETTNSTVGGEDSIDAGSGDMVVMGGRDGDEIRLGNGDHSIAGDLAELDFTNGIRTDFTALTNTPSVGGDDLIETGDGRTWIIAGEGGDDVTTGDGGGVVLGDSGRIQQSDGLAMIRVESFEHALGGTDEIDMGFGDAVVFGGRDSDTIRVGSGDHVIAGDFAELDYTSGARTDFNALNDLPSAGAGDLIEAGQGNNWVIAGQGADTVALGPGGAVVLGDNGRIRATSAGALTRVETANSEVGGNDSITAGDGDVVAFGGFGDDTIRTAGGDDVIAGDMAELDYEDGVRNIFASVIEDPAFGGDDQVWTGEGDDWVLLGEGDDTVTSEGGLNIAIGDAGVIQADTTGAFYRAENNQFATGGDDTFYGGTGRDIQIGGAGSDYLDGGAGNDFMAGDGGLIHVDPVDNTYEITFESTEIEVGGPDTLIGGEGRDVMLGGIGNDTFDLNIAEDIVAGEFARVRMRPDPNSSEPDKEVVTSFLTPAVRDIDLLAQITMGVNFSSGKTEVEVVPGSDPLGTATAVPSVSQMLAGMRVDLVLSEDEVGEDADLATLLATFDTPARSCPE
ncbi:calcium-binding protein [Oceanicola sp. S124]|uniref:calcium-binding protein n=1 Tax=Oceanicola sp. S124 TaxID=1042378 RepID=UPI00110F84DF|nr:calcium-binding protein [Oceanicola sp. S124]